MARTVRDSKLDARSARLKLPIRREPYWRSISQGFAIGYRRGKKGGTWIARQYTPGKGREYNSLGTSNDVADADGVNILDFAQAQEKARDWFARLASGEAAGADDEPYAVRDAITDYLADYERRGGRSRDRMEYQIDAHILPEWGDKELSDLTRSGLRAWHYKLAKAPARLRTRRGGKQKYRELSDDDEAIRQRRSTANKVLTMLKAALNYAYSGGKISGNEVWDSVKPFRDVDAAKVRYLSDDESRRLVNACPADLRGIVTAALLTGARYGEIARLKCSNFNSDAGTLHITQSKSGKPRHIVLTTEGSKFFAAVTTGKARSALMFTRSSGNSWQHAHQYRPLAEACKGAKISPAIGFHILRHCYGSRLAMRGVPMKVVAEQLGHSGTRATEKHYAHLAPSYTATTVRAAFEEIGIVEDSNVVVLDDKR